MTESICELYSVKIQLKQLETTLEMVKMYRDHYVTRLNAANSSKLQQILLIIKALVAYLKGCKVESEAILVNNLLHSLGIDDFNLWELKSYLSGIARKVLLL